MSKNIGYTVIPNYIKYDNELSFISRLLLADILAYSQVNHCFQKNSTFASLYNVSLSTIEKAIKQLKQKEYIYTSYNPSLNLRVIIPKVDNNPYWEKLIQTIDNFTNEEMLNLINTNREKNDTKKQNNHNQKNDIQDMEWLNSYVESL